MVAVYVALVPFNGTVRDCTGNFFSHETARCSATKCFAAIDQIKEFRMVIQKCHNSISHRGMHAGD